MSEVDQEALRAAADVAEEEAAGPPQKGTVTLSNGIVLKLKPVPPFLLRQAVTKLKEPKPPMADIGKGRKEENPNDPEYLAAVAIHQASTIEAVTNVAFVMGTEAASIPDGLCGPEDDAWLEILEILEIEVDQRPKGRYLGWLRYYAVTSQEDVLLILSAMSTRLGLTEEEVGLAADSFPGGEVRGANNRASPADVGHGDNVRPTAPRRRSRGGGKRSG